MNKKGNHSMIRNDNHNRKARKSRISHRNIRKVRNKTNEGSIDLGKENCGLNSNLMQQFTKTIDKFDRKLAKIRHSLDETEA